jgi:hypothetical protein
MNKTVFLKTTAAAIMLLALSMPCHSQFNVQLHRDFGHALYGKDLKSRPNLTLTPEFFNADKWGSTYLFIDMDLAGNGVKSAYGEFSRELKFWKAPVSVHVEYDGGLKNSFSYNDAYLAGAAYNWNSKDFNRTFSAQLMYKYLANVSQHHSWQTTIVWGLNFADGLFRFNGFADLWHDNSVNGSLIFLSEPQFWFNFNALKGVDKDFNLSFGGEVELSNNFVYPDDANKKNNRFYALPTLALKWTF